MTSGNHTLQADRAVEDILRNAPPRPVPSAEHVAAAREAVGARWRTVTGRRRRRRRLLAYAVAATVLLAVALGVDTLRVPSALPAHVATIDRTTGSIYLLGEHSTLHETRDLTDLLSGQTLVTGRDSRAAISWSRGGALRIDENSRVEFVSPDEVWLHSGRIYVDSQPLPPQAGITQSSIAGFAVQTAAGTVSHVGTQYMTAIDANALTVSVREGQVNVAGKFVDASAAAGQQVVLSGNGRPVYTNIGTHGESWLWIEKMVPEVDLDQRSAHEFIRWAGRETGLEVRFSSRPVEELARRTQMIGTIATEPRVALQTLLQTTDLQANIEDGQIIVSER